MNQSNQSQSLIDIHHSIFEGLRALGQPGVVEHVLSAVSRHLGVPSAYVFAPYLYGPCEEATPASQSLHMPRAVKMEYHSGMPAQFFQQYASRVWQIDPWREALATKMDRLIELGGVIGHQHIPHRAMYQTGFYQDYLKPEIGMESMMCAMLESGYWLGFMRSTRAGDFQEEDLRFVNQFKSQLAAFLVAHHQCLKLQAEQTQTLQVFDQLFDGVVIANGQGEIHMVNATASRYLGLPKKAFGNLAGKSLLLLPQIHRALWALVQKARHQGLAQSCIESPAYPQGLHASVTWQSHPHAAYEDYAYIELAGSSKLDIAIQVQKCAKHCGLTLTEAMVLARLVDKTPQEIAKDLGLKITTVRSHLASVFAKTHTRRQSELLWLLASS